MPESSLIGSRIRERRALVGQRQAQLAQAVGISPSYLNLIEHNKRKIGGKLLIDIANELDVDVALLSQGAEANLVASLRHAAEDWPDIDPEVDRIDEFAGRFPGWAKLVAASQEQIMKLEKAVEALSDRMSYDPLLSASMHEVLSTVTSIHSTATILAENKEIGPEWNARFLRNINEDSSRLAESAQSLVQFLDAGSDNLAAAATPQQEVEQFLSGHGYHFPELETPSGDPEALLENAEVLKTVAAKKQASQMLGQYAKDAVKMPLATMRTAVQTNGIDPSKLAALFDVSPGTVLRRLAVMPTEVLKADVGLVVCDAPGSLQFHRKLEGFGARRFMATRAQWPLFEALSRPMQPIRRTVEVPDYEFQKFECFAVSEPINAFSFDEMPIYEAYMLIVPSAYFQQEEDKA